MPRKPANPEPEPEPVESEEPEPVEAEEPEVEESDGSEEEVPIDYPGESGERGSTWKPDPPGTGADEAEEEIGYEGQR